MEGPNFVRLLLLSSVVMLSSTWTLDCVCVRVFFFLVMLKLNWTTGRIAVRLEGS